MSGRRNFAIVVSLTPKATDPTPRATIWAIVTVTGPNGTVSFGLDACNARILVTQDFTSITIVSGCGGVVWIERPDTFPNQEG